MIRKLLVFYILYCFSFDISAQTQAPLATAATKVTKTGFTANWTSVSGVTSYDLQVNTSADFSAATVQTFKSISNTSFDVTGLLENTVYYYRVYPAGTAAYSNIKMTSTMLPPGSGNALTFDGTNYVKIKNPDAVTKLTKNYTIEAWINPSAWDSDPNSPTNNYQNGIVGNDGLNYGFELRGGGLGTISFVILNSIGMPEISSKNEVAVDGSWTHVAVSVDNNMATLYINGVQDAQKDLGVTPVSFNSGNSLWIGGTYDGNNDGIPNRFFKGEIDEVRIWDRALSESDLRTNMCKKLQGNEAGLITYFRLDENSGTITENKAAGSSEDGELMKAPKIGLSGALLGDLSAYTYSSVADAIYTTNLDVFSVKFTATASNQGVHVYKVNEAPNLTTVPAGLTSLETTSYYGVFRIGARTYDVSYDYSNTPLLSKEPNLVFATRSDNSSSAWAKLTSTVNITNHSLSATGQTLRFEYLIGVAQQVLPSLSLCATTNNEGSVSLNWPSIVSGTQYTIVYGTEQTKLDKTFSGTAPITIPASNFDQVSTYYFAVQSNGVNSEIVAATPVNGTSGKWLDFSNPDTGSDLNIKTEVEFPYSSDFNMGMGDFTVEAWYQYDKKSTLMGFNPVLVTFNDKVGQNGFTIGFYTPSELLWVHIAGGNYYPAIPTGVNPFDGLQHHYAISRRNSVIYTYIDGIESLTTIPSSHNLSYLDPSTSKIYTALTIGSGHFSDRLNFDGKIDEVRLWNVGLIKEQIKNQKDRLLLESEKTGLVANWHFDESQGDIAYDATCNGHNGKWLNKPFAETSKVVFTNQLNVYAIAGNQRVEVNWSKIPAHTAATVYTVSYGTDTTTNGTLSTVTVTGQNSTIITGLENDKLYFFAVSVGGEQSKFDAAVPRKESGKALKLDGTTNQFVQVEPNSAFDTQNYTAEFWFKPTFAAGSIKGDPCLLSLRIGEVSRFSIHLGNNRKSIGFWGTGLDWSDPIDMTEDRWYHMAVTDDGIKANLFIDGKKVSDFEKITRSDKINLSFNIGSNNNNDELFPGEIDEVRIWNVIRDLSEINNYKDSTLRGDEDGLVGLWHLDEPTGNVAYDATPNGLNGKWINGPKTVESKAMHPYKPTGLVIDKTTLTWDDNIAVDVKKYKILQKSISGWDIIDSTADAATRRYLLPTATSCLFNFFKVVGVDFAGQVGMVSDSISIPQLPSLNSKLTYSKDTVFCEGESIELTAATGADDYEWYYGNQLLQKGAELNSYTATLSGVYRCISKIGNCIDTSQFVHVKSILPLASSLKADKPEVCAGDTATLSVDALNGNSFKFNGTKDSYLINEKVTFKEYKNIMSFEGWFKAPANSVSTATLMSFRTKFAGLIYVEIFKLSNPKSLEFLIVNSNTETPPVVSSGINIADGKWHHIAITFRNNIVNIFDNSKLKISKKIDGDGFKDNIPGSLVFGQAQPSNFSTLTDPFTGEMDEVRFWDIELDAATIANNYQLRLNGSEPGLIFLAHLNEPENSKVAKEQKSGYDLEIKKDIEIIEGGGNAGTDPNFKYEWTKTGSTVSLGNTNKLKVTESGEYTINWGNSTCATTLQTKSQKVNVISFSPKITNVANTTLDSTICGLPTFTLNASKGDKYKWLKEGAFETEATQDWAISKSGIYKVVIDSSIGSLKCSDTTMPVTITFQANPEKPVFSIDKEYCAKETLPSISVTNSKSNSTYISSINQVENPNQSTSLISVSSIDNTQAGTYSIGIQAIDGICKSEISLANLVINPIPEPAQIASLNPVSVCQDAVLEPVKLTLVSGVNYLMKNTSTGAFIKNQSGVFSASDLGLNTTIPSTTTFVGVLEQGGCEGKPSDSISIQVVPKALAPTIVKSANELCTGSGVELVASGGNVYQWYRQDENGILYKIVNATKASYNAVVPGEYKVVATDVQQLACPSDTASQQVNLSTNIYSKPSISQTKTGNVTLIQATTLPGKYQWFVESETPNEYRLIVGATSNSFTTQYSGRYMFKVIYKDYCAAFSNAELVNDASYLPASRMATMVGDTALYLPEIHWGIGTYPNPFNEKLHISLPNAIEGMSISLTDINGQLLFEKQSAASFEEIETSSFAAGMYLLKVLSGGKSEVFLVEKVK